MNNTFIPRIGLFACAVMYLSGCAGIMRRPVLIPQRGVYHIVGGGQTLYRIAKTYNVDLNEIIRQNRITDPARIEAGQRVFIPGVSSVLPVEIYRPITKNALPELIRPRYGLERWRYITIHHSATSGGNAACFDKNHRSRKMGGLFYHFVIGNGTLSADGEIEVGWRWREQKEVNRPHDIQVCLVGNFNNTSVGDKQMESLVNLIYVLQKQQDIPLSNIRMHKDIPGKNTECPGNKFPMRRILTELKTPG